MIDLSEEIASINGVADLLWRMASFAEKEQHDIPAARGIEVLHKTLLDAAISIERKTAECNDSADSPLTEGTAGIEGSPPPNIKV